MKKTLMTVCMLAMLRLTSGCIGPATTEEDAGCISSRVTEILDSANPSHTNILNVIVSQDSVGNRFQTASLLFGSTDYVNGATSLTLVVNDAPQVTTVWNGRVVGLGRSTEVTEDRVQQNFCANSASFWEVQVGFGTIGEDPMGSRDPGFSEVGHLLREGQEIELRLDVCRGDQCIQGVSRTFRVHLMP